LGKYSIAIRFLNDVTEKNSNGKNHIYSIDTNRATCDTNTDQITVLLRHLRNNYTFIVGYCCYPYT